MAVSRQEFQDACEDLGIEYLFDLNGYGGMVVLHRQSSIIIFKLYKDKDSLYQRLVELIFM